MNTLPETPNYVGALCTNIGVMVFVHLLYGYKDPEEDLPINTIKVYVQRSELLLICKDEEQAQIIVKLLQEAYDRVKNEEPIEEWFQGGLNVQKYLMEAKIWKFL